MKTYHVFEAHEEQVSVKGEGMSVTEIMALRDHLKTQDEVQLDGGSYVFRELQFGAENNDEVVAVFYYD